MNDEKLNKVAFKASNQARSTQNLADANEPILVTMISTPIKSQKLTPVVLTFLLMTTATASIGLYSTSSPIEVSPRAVTYSSETHTAPTVADAKVHKPLTLEQIKGFAEVSDETYMDTVIRYLGTHYEQVDDARLNVMLQEVTAEYTSKGFELSSNFLEDVAKNRMYKEILHLATGNISYATIREEVTESVPMYTSYFVVLNENVDNAILKDIDVILREETDIKEIEARLKERKLWGRLHGSISNNTPNYMEDSFTAITNVAVGETIVNSLHNYVAKLLKKEPVTEESLITMYIAFLDYGDFREVLNIYVEMLPEPYRMDEDLLAILQEPTEAYTDFLAKQS